MAGHRAPRYHSPPPPASCLPELFALVPALIRGELRPANVYGTPGHGEPVPSTRGPDHDADRRELDHEHDAAERADLAADRFRELDDFAHRAPIGRTYPTGTSARSEYRGSE